MERSVKHFKKQVIGWFTLLLVGTGIMLSGCAHFDDRAVRPIWKERDQYVVLEKQDRSAGSLPVANAHPANVSTERLSSLLESLEVRIPGQKKTQSLFNPAGIQILSEKIKQGLAAAAPGEDVTFAYVGTYPVLAMMAILKEDKITTGRVFCQDGKINIIFGLLNEKVNEKEDRRLNPYLPGSRSKVTPQEWVLVEKSGGEGFTRKRPDWLVFPLAAPAFKATSSVEPAVPVDVPAAAVIAPVVPDVTRATPVQAVKKSPEERLTILNGLKSKGLVTEEEYRAKRQEILNDL